MKRFWAWILIALMVPGGLANAKAFVWCTGADGHSAIEFCVGADCHGEARQSQVEVAESGGHDVVLAHHQPHHEPGCVDAPALPHTTLTSFAEAKLYSANFDGSSEDATAHDPSFVETIVGPTSINFYERLRARQTQHLLNPLRAWHRITVLRL